MEASAKAEKIYNKNKHTSLNISTHTSIKRKIKENC